MLTLRQFSRPFDLQRGHLFPWVAVLYAIGIGIFFLWPEEPDVGVWVTSAAIFLVAGVFSVFVGSGARPLALIVLVPAIGFGVAGLRTELVAATKLSFRYYGPIEGRVVGIDRSQSDAVRLTLDQVILRDVPPIRTPERVRVSLHGDFGIPRPCPGALVGLTGHLSPPGGPVEPGGYDFQRHAWFLGIGAVGYTRNPVVTFALPEPDLSSIVLKIRFRIADRIREVLDGEAGGFAAAITTGDRSTLDQATMEALRTTNLAHLLAISGLHMGLLTGFVFAALRFGMASIAWMSLRLPVKKIAAIAALFAGALYLILSGNSVATERAYIMVAVMLVAVLTDRRAVTLRAVAIAALLVLTLRPETLLGPGFQMSFAATIALVTVFRWINEWDWSKSRWPWAFRVIGGVAMSSAVAGFATAPIAAVHFNQIPHYGLIANVLSVPLMGLVIIPGAVLAAILSLVGAEALGLAIMDWPILWILAVAREVAGWNGALTYVVTPGPIVLPMIGIAGVTAALAVGNARLVALPMLAVAFGLWSQSDRPQVLVSASGGQVAAIGLTGMRVPSRARGDGFATRSWLENDGDPVSQAEAANREGWSTSNGVRSFALDDLVLAHGTGTTGSQTAIEHCGKALVIVNKRVVAPENCNLLDPDKLARTGSVAVSHRNGRIEITPTRRAGAGRRWSQ